MVLDACYIEKVCENGGGCLITTEEPYYKCQCDVGFSGKNCEIKSLLYKLVIIFLFIKYFFFQVLVQTKQVTHLSKTILRTILLFGIVGNGMVIMSATQNYVTVDVNTALTGTGKRIILVRFQEVSGENMDHGVSNFFIVI